MIFNQLVEYFMKHTPRHIFAEELMKKLVVYLKTRLNTSKVSGNIDIALKSLKNLGAP